MRYYPALFRRRLDARRVSRRWRVMAGVVVLGGLLLPLWLGW